MAQIMNETQFLQYLNANDIDHRIVMEMQYFKNVCMTEEENYIREELAKNPIDITQRLIKTNQQQQIEQEQMQKQKQEQEQMYDQKQHSQQQQQQHQQQQQEQKCKTIEQYKRSEACRRSRLNRKIKIMKNKYRCDFMADKLKLTTHYLEYIRSIITDMELQLIHHRFITTKHLHDLRKLFKIYQPINNDDNDN